MVRVILLLILCCSLLPISAAEWIGYRFAVATIYVQPGEEDLARELAQMANEEAGRLMEPLGLSTLATFPIYAYTNRTAFLRDAGPDPLLLGVSYRPSGLIRLDVTGVEGPVRSVLAHEMTHTLLNQRLGRNIGGLPVWVNEGIAGFLSSPVSQRQLVSLGRLHHPSGLLSIEAMDNAFDQHTNASAAYLQSSSMVAWLVYRYPGSLQRILAGMSSGLSFEMALWQVTELTPERWLQQWSQGIPAYEVWLSLLATPVVYAPMAILIAIIAIIRRNRRQEAMEDDEPDAGVRRRPPPPLSAPSIPAPVSLDLAGYALLGTIPLLGDMHTPRQTDNPPS